MYNTQTEPKPPKPVTSQKKMLQYTNRAKTCHQSEKDVKYSTRAKTCQQSKKDGTILKQNNPVTSQKKMVQNSNSAQTCHQSEKDGTILKQGQNLSPVRKRWHHTQIEPKPVTSQKKM